jgi:2-C-methyl-D-erythritol 4-phosphate cytidylyltransferase
MSNSYFLIVPASGIGARMHTQNALPKQYIPLKNGLNILEQTLKTLLNIEKIQGCVVAISKTDLWFKASKFSQHKKILATAIGGKERVHSVLNALNALAPFVKKNDWVLVHDAVRCCITKKSVNFLMKTLSNHPIGGILASPVVDTLKQVNNNNITKTIDRQELWQAQTPQMFRYSVLLNALNHALKNGFEITDEASAIEYYGLTPRIIPNTKNNLKITTPEDLDLANFYLHQYAH